MKKGMEWILPQIVIVGLTVFHSISGASEAYRTKITHKNKAEQSKQS